MVISHQDTKSRGEMSIEATGILQSYVVHKAARGNVLKIEHVKMCDSTVYCTREQKLKSFSEYQHFAVNKTTSCSSNQVTPPTSV